MPPVSFRKMHGAGNDFVVVDARKNGCVLDSDQVRLLADRRYGVGCDQVIVIEDTANADARMRIYNHDGGEVSSCGNASRCVSAILMKETGEKKIAIETKSGLLLCRADEDDLVTVDMGRPKDHWRDIPLGVEVDSLEMEMEAGMLKAPVGVGMGNPHAVFFVDDAAAVPLHELGPELEHHPLYPERANIGIAQVINEQAIRLRVWERGAGETLACGTGACAALVAAHRRGLTERKVDVMLPGGMLQIEWLPEDQGGHVLMTGPVATVFTGEILL